MDGYLVYVDVKRASVLRSLGRPQRWYWVALSGENFKKMAVSSERYTNLDDCYHAIDVLFGTDTYAYRREAEHGNLRLRLAQEQEAPPLAANEPRTERL